MKVLLIDNYDSFTFNLYQLLSLLLGNKQKKGSVVVVKNDEVDPDWVNSKRFDRIILSPGPGGPKDGGISLEVLAHCHQEIPILGVCLGHQIIAHYFGAMVTRAKVPLHGRTSAVFHNNGTLFSNVPERFLVARYHSLIVEDETLPSCFKVTARSQEGEIMAIDHREHPIFGVQFHPESFLTEYGKNILENFLRERLAKTTLQNMVSFAE